MLEGILGTRGLSEGSRIARSMADIVQNYSICPVVILKPLIKPEFDIGIVSAVIATAARQRDVTCNRQQTFGIARLRHALAGWFTVGYMRQALTTWISSDDY